MAEAGAVDLVAIEDEKVTAHVTGSVGDLYVVQLWAPAEPQGTLLLLHGYYDHMGLYRHVVDWALSMNFAVLACDLPGHGLSVRKYL